VFLYAPIAVVIVYSFNAAKRGGPWRGFTTDWYTTLFNSPEKLMAVLNTLILALISTALSTALGALLGYGLSRCAHPVKRAVSSMLYVPVVIPDIVFAVAMLTFYSLVRDWLGLLRLGLTTMIIAHVTFQIPFVALVVRSRLAGLDPAIEEAAQDLGASAAQTFRHVTLRSCFPESSQVQHWPSH
jgi:spermidine/putrescine transport system permease protein